MKPLKLENKGLVKRSFEGIMEWGGYDKREKCNDDQDQCYTPALMKAEFSIRPDNARAVKFIGENLEKEMVIKYKIHRVTPVFLSTNFEIIDCFEIKKGLPPGMPEKHVVKQTGNRRNFSVEGKFLKIERRGSVIKTYEILYYDRRNDRIHPASIVDENMAKLAIQSMAFDVEFNFGISVSFVDGVRESSYDVFEINYKGKAGLSPVQ